jgi:FkbM family methyltransferase
MIIFNENGVEVDTENIEDYEQYLANKYILENDVVLELGARYGSVSCIINSKLDNKYNQVVVEPDSRVWDVLEKNKIINNCKFNIVKGFISNKRLGLENLDDRYGYGTTSIETDDTNIPSYTLHEIEQKYNLKFNVLVADCEGFLETFFDENPELYDKLELLIHEADYPEKCNYGKIKTNLKNSKFINILKGFQNVWVKDSVYKQRGINNSHYPFSNSKNYSIRKPISIRNHTLNKLSFN